MPGSAITPATASEDETKYPPGFDKLLSLKHIFYCGWLAAIHGTYWGLIFAWTTFFGILRDGGDHKHLLVWFVGTALFLNCATKVWAHFENTPSMRIMIWHGYVFFSAGILCTLTAGATSYFYRLGHEDILPDVGFWLFEEAKKGTVLSKISGFMATGGGLICIARQVFEGNNLLCVRWFRCMAIVYGLRTLTLFLTSLPGPAPHCRGEYLLRPTGFWAVMGRIRAMYGGEENCGDLIFSGHTAFVTVSVYTLLHGSWKWKRLYRFIGWAYGFGYITLFGYAVLAARKHYSVDVWLGFVIGTLVFMSFSDGWKPAFFEGFRVW